MDRLAARLLLLALALPTLAIAQNCPAPVLPSPQPANIFTPQQEKDAGDIIAEQLEHEFKVVHDDALNAYLQRIGSRLATYVDPGLPVRFVLADFPEANAITMPGGRIYVSRKLVAYTRSEDELAGVMAHELGHVVARDAAVSLSERFRAVLGITQVGDKADISAKYNRLIENIRTRKSSYSERSERREQTAADRVGMYLMVRAGYSSQAFLDFLDRLTDLKGNRGSWLTDLFGLTNPDAKRLREDMKSIGKMPPECVQSREKSSTHEFQEWQQAVVAWKAAPRTVGTLQHVVSSSRLEPALRTDISHVRFSPDGKYILAQDDTSVYILTREPFEYKFRITAPEFHSAAFSPDGKNVVLYSRELRVESWNIAEQKRNWVHELVTTTKGCIQTALSPDGTLFACVTDDLGLRLVDVATGNISFEKKDFYRASGWDLFDMQLGRIINPDSTPFMMQFSPEGRYFIAARRNQSIMVDTTTSKTVSLPGSIRDLLGFSFTFLGPDRIFGVAGNAGEKSALVRFPSGEVLTKAPLGIQGVIGVTRGEFIMLTPIKDFALGVYDLGAKKIVLAYKTQALDIFGDQVVGESANGEMALFDVKEPTDKNSKALVARARVTLPLSDLGRIRAVAVSEDFKEIAVSLRSRGAVWDLQEKQRLVFLRGFRGIDFDGEDTIYADFPKLDKDPRTIAKMNLRSKGGEPLIEVKPSGDNGGKETEQAKQQRVARFSIESNNVTQHGRYLLVRNRLEQKSGQKIEIRDVRTNGLLWTREFTKDKPYIYLQPAEDKVLFEWDVSASGAQALLSDPNIRNRYNSLGNKKGAKLIEVLDAKAGTNLGALLIETGKNSFVIDRAEASGDWLTITDDQNRSVLYSISSGEQKAHVFGSYATISSRANLMSVENEAGNLALYHIPDMRKLDEWSFPSDVSFMRFSKDGKRLFVLTKDQSTFLLDTATPTASASADNNNVQ